MEYNNLDHSAFPLFCSPDCLLNAIQIPVTGHRSINQTAFPANFRRSKEFRSNYERYFALFLRHHKIKYKYEPYAIRLAIGDRWIPDFELPDYNKLIEVKGLWYSGSKKKMKQVAYEIGPDIVIVVPDRTCKQLRKWNNGSSV